MHPFEFIILFFSFIYTLALTHILFAATRMIRHRRRLAFSWPHALWMLNALLVLLDDWISLWDFHAQEALSLALVAGGLVLVAIQYFLCALVAPDFDDGERFDMRAFHAPEGRTYIAGFLVLMIFSLFANAGAGLGAGVSNWLQQNVLVMLMIPPIVLALAVRARWAQIVGPALLATASLAYLVVYYPVLK